MTSGNVREYVTEDGMLVREGDGITTRQCVTEECIEKRLNKRRCTCGSCVSERVEKELEGEWTVEELREKLPQEKFERVMDHLDLDVPIEDVEKGVVFDNLTPSERVEKGDLAPPHHLGDPTEDDDVDVDEIGKSLAMTNFYHRESDR